MKNKKQTMNRKLEIVWAGLKEKNKKMKTKTKNKNVKRTFAIFTLSKNEWKKSCPEMLETIFQFFIFLFEMI